MRKITYFKTMLLAGMLLAGSMSVKAQLLVEDFDYTIGSLLTAKGWTAHSGAGTNSEAVLTSTITYPGYLSSGLGGETALIAGSVGEDVNRTFTAQTSGTIFASFLVNVTSPTLTGDYFFHIGASTIATTFRGRVFVKKDASNNIYFGISQGASPAIINYTTTAYSLNTTYLIVLKYDIVPGTTNDVASIYINPTLNAPIPTTGWTTNTDGAVADLANVGSVALRQGGATSTPALKIDGIRISTLWSDIVGAEGSSCTTSSLAFASSTVDKLVADINFTNIPTSNSNGAITYSSSVETVATVNLNTGEVDILGAGSTVITASQAAEGIYCANSATYTLNVGTTAPTISITEVITVPEMKYLVGNGPSLAQSFNVSGSNLTLELGINAPTNFQISLTGVNEEYSNWIGLNPQSGTVANAIVYVRLNAGLAAGNYSGDILLNSVGAPQQTVSVTGRVTQPAVMPNVIISEVFGGGGNTGATLKNDFVELYNTSAETVQIGGWSLQYFGATGTGEALITNVFVIPEGRYIPSGSHFLIKALAGAGGTQDIIDQDATSTLSLSGTSGKIILYNTNIAQTISDIASITSNPNFVDYVPYGTTATPVWESAMTSNVSSTTSATRNTAAPSPVGGQRASAAVNYIYTGNIGNDFSIAAPSPTATGISTGLKTSNHLEFVYTSNGNVVFKAAANQLVEIYNAVGQRIVSKNTNEGLNTIAIAQKGVMLVKVGNQISKVIL